MPATSEVVLVRHGETEWSANGRHTSRTDLPLVESGRKRAAALRGPLSHYSFSLVLTSPLLRARETCQLAGYGDVAQVDDDVREWGYGEYEGLTTPQIRETRPGWSLWRDGCPGGDSPLEIEARADRVLARLTEAKGASLVFAHGHILRVLCARWLSMDAAGGARFALSAGTISVLGHERETRVIHLWNAVPSETAGS